MVDAAMARVQEVKSAEKGSIEHKEKRLLIFLISDYAARTVHLPGMAPVDLILTRMVDLNLKASDLAAVYGDKGTVSKVLNYKQALSITMIRKFSKLLQIPEDSLLRV